MNAEVARIRFVARKPALAVLSSLRLALFNSFR